MADWDARLEGTERVRIVLGNLQGKPLERALRKSLVRAARKTVQPVMKAEARSIRNSGLLERSITTRQGKGTAAVTGPRPKVAPHRHFVILGTKPHAIAPRRRQALAFGGSVVEQIQHPGSRGNPFVTRAWNQAKGEMKRETLRDIVRESQP